MADLRGYPGLQRALLLLGYRILRFRRPQVLHKRAHRHRRKPITRIVIRGRARERYIESTRPAVRLVVSE